MNRRVVLVCGLAVYAIFLFTFCYMIGFVGNWVVPKSIDSGVSGALVPSAIVNLVLMSLFAVQHSTMARLKFKAWWTTIVPEPVERSTYVWLTSLILLLMAWQWRPMTAVVWHVDSGALAGILHGVYFLGWGTVLYSTVLIDHFDLFGVRQVTLYARGEDYTPVHFQLRSLYRVMRHPLLAGFMIAFWATPHMTAGHLLFAVVTTAYMLVGIQLEERTLLAMLGDDYAQYRDRVSMLVPLKGIAPADWTPTPHGGEPPAAAE
jgi:protein-S-isoprenylcysteine O-methyltransferase Ste14